MLAYPFADRVGENQQNEADHGVEQADRRRIPEVRAQDPFSIHVSGDDVGGLVGQRVIEQDDFLAADGKHRTYVEDEQNDDRRHDAGNRDVQRLLPAPRAVDSGRVIQRRIDGRHGGKVNDRAPAYALPDPGRDIERTEPTRLLPERDRLVAEKADDAVDQAVAGEEIHHHPRYDHDRDKMREIADRLNQALEHHYAKLVEQQRENDRSRESEQQLIQAYRQRVSKQSPKVRVFKKVLEVRQSDPGTSPYPVGHAVVFERDQQPVHRTVVENAVINQHRHKHQIDMPVANQIPFDKASFMHQCSLPNVRHRSV